jgi:hypothetical protein
MADGNVFRHHDEQLSRTTDTASTHDKPQTHNTHTTHNTTHTLAGPSAAAIKPTHAAQPTPRGAVTHTQRKSETRTGEHLTTTTTDGRCGGNASVGKDSDRRPTTRTAVWRCRERVKQQRTRKVNEKNGAATRRHATVGEQSACSTTREANDDERRRRRANGATRRGRRHNTHTSAQHAVFIGRSS